MACSLSLCPVPAVTWPTILLLTLQPLLTHTHTPVRTHTSTHQHIQLFCGIFLLKFPPFFNSSTISEVCFLLVSRAALAGLCVLGGCHLDLLFDLASQLTDLPLISPDPWLAGEKAKEKVMT